MPICVRPLVRAETFEAYTNKKGEKSFKAIWLERDFYDETMRKNEEKYFKYKYRRVDLVPCGKCLECQIGYARDWAVDCLCEKEYWPKNECWFVTLTYDDEHVPAAEYKTEEGKSYKGISLRKKDVQDFIKRLRDHKGNLKYLCCGEYGTKGRPHYHLIIFGLNIKDQKFWANNQNGDALWTSEELKEIWGKGNVIVGEVTYRSVNYTVRYTLKKWKNKESSMNKLMGRIDEFILVSQGIGYRYWEEHYQEMLKQRGVITSNGLKPLTKRFFKWLKNKDMEAYTTQKATNKQIAESAQKELDNLTDVDRETRRKQSEERQKSQFIDMRRKTE